MAVLYKIVVDCVDPHRLAAFWAVALDYLLEDHSTLVQRLLDGGMITEADARTVDGRLTFANAAAVRDPDAPVNPEALKGHEGHHVQVSAHLYSDKNAIHVMSVKMLK